MMPAKWASIVAFFKEEGREMEGEDILATNSINKGGRMKPKGTMTRLREVKERGRKSLFWRL